MPKTILGGRGADPSPGHPLSNGNGFRRLCRSIRNGSDCFRVSDTRVGDKTISNATVTLTGLAARPFPSASELLMIFNY